MDSVRKDVNIRIQKFMDAFESRSGPNLTRYGFRFLGFNYRVAHKSNDSGEYRDYRVQMRYEGPSVSGCKLAIEVKASTLGFFRDIDDLEMSSHRSNEAGEFCGESDADNWWHWNEFIKVAPIEYKSLQQDLNRLNLNRDTWKENGSYSVSMDFGAASKYADQIMLPRLFIDLHERALIKALVPFWPSLAIDGSAKAADTTRRRRISSSNTMQHVLVNSGNLSSVGYDEASQILEIRFNSGRLYQYDDVPEEVYEQLMREPSQSRFFAFCIRNVYPYREMQ